MDYDLKILDHLNSDRLFFNQTNYGQVAHLILKKYSYFSRSSEIYFKYYPKAPDQTLSTIIACYLARKKILLLSEKNLQKNHSPFISIYNNEAIHDIETNHVLKIPKKHHEPFLYLNSSGSSTTPKSLEFSLDNLIGSARAMINFLKLNSTDITLLNLPLYHVGGFMILLRTYLSEGRITSDINDNYTVTSLVPLQLQRMLDSSCDQLKKCKAILVGGGSISEKIKLSAKKQKLNLYETYGMTETASAVMINGQSLEHANLKFVKEDQSGFFTIYIQSTSLSKGYYQDGHYYPLKLSTLENKAYFKTSDRAVYSNGKIISIERTDLCFKSGGYLINPSRIEKIIAENFDDLERVVSLSIPHPKWENMHVLFYQGNCEITLELLKNKLNNHLESYELPKICVKIDSDLEGIKSNRSELKNRAYEIFLQKIFSHQYIKTQKNHSLIIFFHGFMQDKLDFLPIAKELYPLNDCLLLDLPGHGETSILDFENNREYFFHCLDSFINLFTKNYTHITYYGYSMGGRIALELSNYYTSPDCLYLESAHFGLTNNNEQKTRLSSDEELFHNLSDGKPTLEFFNNWYANPIFGNYKLTSGYNEDCLKKLNHDMSEWKKSLSIFSLGKDRLLENQLSALKNKKFSLHLISGELDQKFSNHYKYIEEQNLLDTQYHHIKDAGHNPHKVCPQEIIQLITKKTKKKED